MAERFLDKVKFFMGLEDYEEEQDDEDMEEVKPQPRSSSAASTHSAAQNNMNTSSSYPVQTKNKVVNIHTNTQMKVVIHQPTSFDEATEIVESLKARKPVIMNLEEIDGELARRIFDFCNGALYAIDGQIQKVSRGIFILAPNNVDVTGKIGPVTSTDDSDMHSVYRWNR